MAVLLTPAEKEAMDDFQQEHKDKDFMGKVSIYLQFSSTWTTTYAPIREMGMEKFTSCLISGYELKLLSFENVKYKIGFNYESEEAIKESPDDVFYAEFYDEGLADFSQSEFEQFIDECKQVSDFYNKYILD